MESKELDGAAQGRSVASFDVLRWEREQLREAADQLSASHPEIARTLRRIVKTLLAIKP